MVKLDPFLIFELLKNVTFCTHKKNINHPLFSLTLIHSLTAKKKVQDGMMYITSSMSNLELASLGLNLYKVEKNES